MFTINFSTNIYLFQVVNVVLLVEQDVHLESNIKPFLVTIRIVKDITPQTQSKSVERSH